MGLDLKTHKLFLDTRISVLLLLPRRSASNPQPAAVLGTFRVLVYGR